MEKFNKIIVDYVFLESLIQREWDLELHGDDLKLTQLNPDCTSNEENPDCSSQDEREVQILEFSDDVNLLVTLPDSYDRPEYLHEGDDEILSLHENTLMWVILQIAGQLKGWDDRPHIKPRVESRIDLETKRCRIRIMSSNFTLLIEYEGSDVSNHITVITSDRKLREILSRCCQVATGPQNLEDYITCNGLLFLDLEEAGRYTGLMTVGEWLKALQEGVQFESVKVVDFKTILVSVNLRKPPIVKPNSVPLGEFLFLLFETKESYDWIALDGENVLIHY